MSRRRPRSDAVFYTPNTPNPVEEDGVTDLRESRHCHAPFPLYSDVEVDRYRSLKKKSFHYPHYLDWSLMEHMEVNEELMQYLTTLGLGFYAQQEWRVFEELSHEFLTTMEFEDAKKKAITFRLLGKPYRATYSTMDTVFGFGRTSHAGPPPNYHARDHWKAISGFDNYSSKGMACGFIKDTSLAICHKFIAYNIFGKEQGNKVNSTEVYMLHCAKTGTKMCPTAIVWEHLHAIQTKASIQPALAQIVTGLAEHFGVFEPDASPPNATSLDIRKIDHTELRGGNFATEDRRVAPYAERKTIINYLASLAAGNQSAAGTSSTRPPLPVSPATTDVDMDEEPQADDDALLTRGDLKAFQAHFDISMAHLGTAIGDFRREVFKRIDAQDHRITTLQGSWDAWRGAHTHPPPSPNHQ